MNNEKTFDVEYRYRNSIRLRDYDYSTAGLYFITICCENNLCKFGEIKNSCMYLNNLGKIAKNYWQRITEFYPLTRIHDYIIMPNHVHGIIEITQNQNGNAYHKNRFQQVIPRSIGSIVRGYKGGVTKWFIENMNEKKLWQRGFHEHIIRTEKSYNAISRYIRNNVFAWNQDKFFSGNS